MTVEEAYRKGFCDAMRCFAVWNSGEQTIGVMRHPLSAALEHPDRFVYYAPPRENSVVLVPLAEPEPRTVEGEEERQDG